MIARARANKTDSGEQVMFTAVCLQTYFDRHLACIIAITSSCRCTRLKRSTLHVP